MTEIHFRSIQKQQRETSLQNLCVFWILWRFEIPVAERVPQRWKIRNIFVQPETGLVLCAILIDYDERSAQHHSRLKMYDDRSR